eukprot:scaffold763_cov402-Prasinococcus_capsulatus_cf.AAC.2
MQGCALGPQAVWRQRCVNRWHCHPGHIGSSGIMIQEPFTGNRTLAQDASHILVAASPPCSEDAKTATATP